MTPGDYCPECDSLNIEVVQTEVLNDRIEQIHICNECPTQFTVSYGNPIVEDVTTFEEPEE